MNQKVDVGTNIAFFECTESHLINLINLGRSYYPPDHHALKFDFLKWLYLENPCGSAKIVASEDQGQIIGVIAFIPIELDVCGIIQNACYAVNVLTHPDHRGKNLFVKMIKYAKSFLAENDIWLLGHPNASATPGWRRQKMNFNDSLHLFMAKPGLYKYKVELLECADQVSDIPSSFWQSLHSRDDIHVKYTPEFICWKYINAPHRKYTVYRVTYNNKFIGLRITRRYKGPVELLIDPVSTIDNMNKLVRCGVRPTLVMHQGTGISGNEVVKACWQLPIRREFPFFVTDWSDQQIKDVSGITLSASDF